MLSYNVLEQRSAVISISGVFPVLLLLKSGCFGERESKRETDVENELELPRVPAEPVEPAKPNQTK